MEIKTVLTCPLKSECTSIKDNKIHRCAWYTKLAGTNPNTGEVLDEQGCAMSWMPMLMIENSMQQRSTSAAVESFRNETVNANQVTQQIMLSQTNPRLL
jgi:hypothetical protein